MRFDQPLMRAKLTHRTNRFVAQVEIEGKPDLAHIANSGRLQQLLVPGNTVFLSESFSPKRKTRYDLTLVKVGETLASADARLPTKLIQEAILEGRLQPFINYTNVKPETRFGDSRLDFFLEGNGPDCYVEVKSVTLVEGGTGLFPDAPTERGRRHLNALARAHSEGYRAAVIFVIQRGDAVRFAPNDDVDPAFGETLRKAVKGGVEAFAYRCEVGLDEITISEPVTICLQGELHDQGASHSGQPAKRR